MLDTGANVNAKMKSLAAGENTDAWTATGDIRAIHMAESLPDGFVPSEANTVSTTDSGTPIYIIFDNEDGAGIIYFYTENNTPVMNPDSGYMFFNNTALTDISGLASWDSSSVVSLRGAFIVLFTKSTQKYSDLERPGISGPFSVLFIFDTSE